MGIYKVTAPRPVLDNEPGEVFEHDFTATEEADLLAAGRLDLVPRTYQVIGSSRVCDTEPGGTFAFAFTVGQEQALIEAGHVERADDDTKPLEAMNLTELRAYAEKVGVPAAKLAELAKPGVSKAKVRTAIDEHQQS